MWSRSRVRLSCPRQHECGSRPAPRDAPARRQMRVGLPSLDSQRGAYARAAPAASLRSILRATVMREMQSLASDPGPLGQLGRARASPNHMPTADDEPPAWAWTQRHFLGNVSDLAVPASRAQEVRRLAQAAVAAALPQNKERVRLYPDPGTRPKYGSRRARLPSPESAKGDEFGSPSRSLSTCPIEKSFSRW